MINVIESINNSSTNGVTSAKKLATTSYAYAKLKALYIASSVGTKITKLVVVGSFLFIGLIFLSVSASIAIGNHLDNIPLGYTIVGLLFFLFGFICFLLRGFFEKKVVTKLSKKFKNQNF